MGLKPIVTLWVLAHVLAFVFSGCAPQPEPPETGTQSAPEANAERGAQLVPVKCSQCHSLDRVEAADKSESEWSATVDRMIGNGLQVTPEEKADIVAYLAQRDEAE